MIGKGQKLEENMENTTLPICEIYNADESQQNRDSWNHRLGEKHGVSKNCRKNRTPAFPYGCALLVERILQADLIIYLDYAGWRAAARYLVRAIKYRKVARPELPPDCFDTFKLHRFLISLFRGARSEIEEALTMVNAEPKVVRLKSPKEMEKYLATFAA